MSAPLEALVEERQQHQLLNDKVDSTIIFQKLEVVSSADASAGTNNAMVHPLSKIVGSRRSIGGADNFQFLENDCAKSRRQRRRGDVSINTQNTRKSRCSRNL